MCVCGETYSYTMYESHAANSYILTMSKSGNIAYTVNKEKWGAVFETEDELMDMLLHEKEFRETINAWKMNTDPGAAEYEDNDEILQLFPKDTTGVIDWKKKDNPLPKVAKRIILNRMFIAIRLKSGK